MQKLTVFSIFLLMLFSLLPFFPTFITAQELQDNLLVIIESYSLEGIISNPYGLAWDGNNLWSIKKTDAKGPVTMFKHGVDNPALILYSAEAPGDGHGITWDGNNIWVSSHSYVYKLNGIDGSDYQQIEPSEGNSFEGLTWRNGYLWLLREDSPDANIFKMDPSGGNVISSFSLSGIGGWVSSLEWDPDKQVFWLGKSGSNLIYMLNGSDPSVIENVYSVSGLEGADGLAYDGTSLWAICEYPRILYRISISDGVNAPPTASFTYSPSSPTTDDAIQFTDTSTDPDGAISAWSWDFGDGETSTLQNPIHQYSSVGTYTVTLTVTDNGGATDNYSQNIDVTGLVANWRFDEGSGNIAHDETANNNDGTIYGATWVDGIFGKALKFDGVDDYVRVAESSTFKPTNSLTITAWIKPEATQNDYASIVSLDYRADGTWAPPFVAYELGASVGTGSSRRPWFRGWEGVYVTSPDALTPGEWHLVVGTFDGSSAKIYVDVELKESATYTGSIHYGTSRDLAIGQRSPYAPGQFFKGLIDEVKIYSGARTADEILADYQAGLKTETSISISPSSFTLRPNSSTTLTATLRDNANNPLANKTVTWGATAGTVSPTSGTTSSSGQVSTTYTAPSYETTDAITTQFVGDNQYYSSSGNSHGQIIDIASTTLLITPSSLSLRPGESTTFTATLTSEGSPVVGKTTSWNASAGNVSPLSGTTDSSGEVSTTYTAPDNETTVALTASFAGDSQYSSSSNTLSGRIAAATVTLTITPSSFTLKAGKSITLTATLTSDAAPLAGETITWDALHGNFSSTTSVTDSRGKATVTFTAPSYEASIAITASYAGSIQYKSTSSSSPSTVTVPSRIPTLLISAIVGIAVIAAAAGIYRWARRPPEMRELKRKLKELEAKFEQREKEVKVLEKELARTKEEKKQLEIKQAIKKKRAEIIDVKKERRWQLNGLLKILKRRHDKGEISTEEYMQTKEQYERELKELGKK